MRRTIVLLGLTVLVLAGCGDPPATVEVGGTPPMPVETDGGRDLLFLGAGTGVRVFDAASSSVTLEAEPAVPSQQGTAVFRAIPRAGGTEVTAFDPESGDARWSTLLPEPLELRIAAQDGSRAVLGPVRPDDGSVAARERTRLTVVGADDVRSYDVEGNVEPETFSIDGSKLFLIDYLPALAPVEYTLRLLDLETGEVGEVYDAHGGHREPMRGSARTQVYSPDGTRLYTYYAITGEPYYEHLRGPYYAFVHVLDLEEGWAHCVVLPKPFGTPGASGATGTMNPGLTVSPDGRHVFVADPNLGMVGELDTELLRVTRTADVGRMRPGAAASAAATGGELVLAFDDDLLAVERGGLTVTATLRATQPVGALHVTRARLYVALADRVEVYDLARLGSAGWYERLDDLVVGSEPVEYFDPSDVPLDATNDVVKCAC